MQWFLFFIGAVMVCSCNGQQGANQRTNVASNGHSATATIDGASGLPGSDGSKLSDFLSRNLSRKGIQPLSNQPLQQRSYVNDQNHIQFDTLQNSTTTIVLISDTGAHESQRMLIDGHTVSDYQWNGVDSMREVMIELDGNSFKHFTFYGTSFYYFEGREMNRSGGSAALVRYQYLYDVQLQRLSSFFDFRVGDGILFGDFNNDRRLDFFNVENEGGLGMDSLNHFSASIYTHQPNGTFNVLTDRNGKTYYLNGNTGEDHYVGENMHITGYYWPVPIK